ncbi:MAG: hypothetical protein MUP30_09625 [Deltaproteobacteria bacterium]|nr:hypothetical protein [Deltaproteobacteria bacterium]
MKKSKVGSGLDRGQKNVGWSMEMKMGQTFKHIALCALWACVILCLLIPPSYALAAGSVCAEVKLEISQELTLERQAFDAHMRITNGLTNISLQAVNIEVRFTDANGATVTASYDPNDTNALFFIRLDSMENINDVKRKNRGRS